MPFLIMEKKMQIADGKVALFHYDLKETSGEFVESSKEGDPVAYLHGKNGIIKGLVFPPAYLLLTEVQPGKGEGVGLNKFSHFP